MSHPRFFARLRFVGWVLPFALAAGCTSTPSTDGPPGKIARGGHAQTSADDLGEVPADPRDPVLAEITLKLLPQKHLLRLPINDALSREALPQYIEELDGAKLFLLQADVDKLSAYADRMDDELRGRDLILARKGAAVAARRRAAVAVMVKEILARPFDFTVADEIETDPKKVAYCKTDDELRERWRKFLKLQALERIKQMEDLLAAKNAPPAKPDDPSASTRAPTSVPGPGSASGPDSTTAPVPEPLSEIPTTFAGREDKARKDLAVRFESRFARDATPEPLDPAAKFLNAIAASYDPHTQYLPPAEKKNFDIAITGTVEGIGALLGEREHYIVVQEVVPGGAAWQEGRLEQGDAIVAVAQQGKQPVDTTDMPIDKVVAMIRGPKGTVVTLTVKKPDATMETIAIKRDVVRIEAAYARGAVLDLGPTHDPVGYVYLPGFYGDIGGPRRPGERNATDDVRALLAAFEKKKLAGAVVDLRGNGGGLLLHARDIAGLFIDRGPIVQVRDSESHQEVLSDDDPAVAFSGNLVILVDRFSASASEIVAGALQDYQRAVIVGTGPTHGKGTVQTVLDLDQLVGAPGESLGVFKLTVQQYFRVNGASTQWKGVIPDIVLPDPASFVESGERSLPHSIPWTSVNEVPHPRLPHSWNITNLVAASRDRVKANPMFAKVEALGKLLQEQRRQTLEPLQLDAWLAEKQREKQAREAIDPAHTELKPLFEVNLVPGPSTQAAASQDKKLRQRFDTWKENLARDAWVAEALHVLGDMAGER